MDCSPRRSWAWPARARFRGNSRKIDTIKIDTSGFPLEIQKGYRTFHAKCNECHGQDTSPKPSFSPALWTSEVKRMQAMASSQFNDEEAKAILDFLNYDESHRKARLKSTASSLERQLLALQAASSVPRRAVTLATALEAKGGRPGHRYPTSAHVCRETNR